MDCGEMRGLQTRIAVLANLFGTEFNTVAMAV